MPNGHIFLSYRSLEADFALKLAADLQKAGIKLWMDKLDGIIVGDIWSKAIDDALKASTGLIAILTDDYFASSFVCADELGYAYTKQLPIYPLLLRDTAEKYLPFWLQNRQYLDFRQHTDEDSYQRQLNELIRHIQKRQSLIAASTAEERYLDALIRKLGKAKSGVLEYVELAAIAESNSVYANPFTEEGWDPSYTLIKPQSRQEKAPQTETLDNILNAIEKLSRFVLIGEPGAGKTTTIRRLAWDAAQRRLKHEPDSPMPLFIELPKWPSTTSIADFIRAEWLLAGDPLDLIKRGEITVFLDGLNEMGAESQDKAELLRNWLASQDMPQRVVITCRAGDYAGELKLGDLPTVQAEPLDEGRIKRFAVNYLGDRAEAFLEHILPASTLQKAVSVRVNDRSLFNLARNPYMLGVLIYLYHTAPNGQLPTNTGALFRELAQRLWERERQKQTTGWIPYEEMERALSKLAFTMIDEDQPTNVPLEYARRHVPDFALLRAAHNATLVDLSDSDLRFYHQLIQEFFAASRLVEVGLDSIVTESPNLVPR